MGHGVNETGTRAQCPCGDWGNLTITLGPSVRKGDSYIVTAGFDQDQFAQDFEDHVMADPECQGHGPFVTKV